MNAWYTRSILQILAICSKKKRKNSDISVTDIVTTEKNLKTKPRYIKKLMVSGEDCAIWGENKDAPGVPMALTTFS